MTVKLTASSSARPHSALTLTLRTGPGKVQIGITYHGLECLAKSGDAAASS